MGGHNMGFSGASRRSSFVTNMSANSLRMYALAASGDVVLRSGSGGAAIWGGEAPALVCPQLYVLPSDLTLVDLLTLGEAQALEVL